MRRLRTQHPEQLQAKKTHTHETILWGGGSPATDGRCTDATCYLYIMHDRRLPYVGGRKSTMGLGISLSGLHASNMMRATCNTRRVQTQRKVCASIRRTMERLKKRELIHKLVAMDIDEILFDVVNTDGRLQFVKLLLPGVRSHNHLNAIHQYIIGKHASCRVTHSNRQLGPL